MKIQDFYRDQNVLVTGATGFLGKAVVEKLLRSCTEVHTIYILVRTKPGSSAQSRLNKLLDNPVFDTLKNENPEAIKKICPLEGDIGLPNLGLNLSDQSELVSKVNVVIHSAAIVKFDAPLDQSLNLNVLGVKRVVELCKQMHNFKALVHISTAYANCDQRGLIEEKIYPPPPGGMEILGLLDDLDKITDNLKYYEGEIQKCRPNTYSYTKAIAEIYLTSEAKSLPLCIVRPSIVTASVAEPVSGWVDNINGATGMIAGIAMGALRLLMLDASQHINMVPVDVVVNTILCAAMKTSFQEKFEYPIVFNCCASAKNLIRNGDIIRLVIQNFQNSKPRSGISWNPCPTLTTCKLWYRANDFLFQYLPALSVDYFMSTISAKGFGLLASYRKLKRATQSLEFFTLNEWQFATDNMKQLHNSLSDEEDKKRFNFDTEKINWTIYMNQYCEGINKLILKPKDKQKELLLGRLPPLHVIHKIIVGFMLLVFGACLYQTFCIF